MSDKIKLKELRAWDWHYITYRASRDSEAKEELYKKWEEDFMHRTYKNNVYSWLDVDELEKSQITQLKNAYHDWENGYAYDVMIKIMRDNGLYPIIKLIGKMPLWLYKAGAFLIQGLTRNSDVRNDMRNKAIEVMKPFMEKFKAFLDTLPKRKILNYTEDSIGLVEVDGDCQNRVFSYHDWRMPKNWTENLDKNKTYIGFEFETNVKSSNIFEHIMEELIKAKVIDDEKVKLVPTSDGSINGNFPVEWVSCPMEPKEAIKVFNIIKKLLNDNGCKYGRKECNGALHIHFSRTENNKKVIWKLLNKLNKMSDYELERTFGLQSNYCGAQPSFLRDFAYNEIYKKLTDASFDSGKINVEVDIENKLADYVGGGHSMNLNFQHRDTYELRTPDGSKDLSVYLEWLKQQGVDLDL